MGVLTAGRMIGSSAEKGSSDVRSSRLALPDRWKALLPMPVAIVEVPALSFF